tara:strand:+ start:10570 stop:11337 length:768 start_codon:yes stop_codon:yes gene_type:complete
LIIFKNYQISFLLIFILLISSCDDTDQYVFIEGCTYVSACNYNSSAEINDGSCLYNDCFGDCGGNAVFDDCDVCGGDNSSCSDCEGNANGDAYLDCCGNCDTNSFNNCIINENDVCEYDVELFICNIEYNDLNEALLTVCANSPIYNISGFQFGLNVDGFIINEVILGDDAVLANMDNYDNSGMSVLAFSLSSNSISSGSDLELVSFKGVHDLSESIIYIVPGYGENGSLSVAGSNAEELSVLASSINWSEIPTN